MNLSKKNIIEGVIGSLITTAILFLLGLLVSNINIVIVDTPTPENSIEWNFEIHPISIELPYKFTSIGVELSNFRKDLNVFLFKIWENNFWMIGIIAFTWLSIFITSPILRVSFLKETYQNKNLYQPKKSFRELRVRDKSKTDVSYIFDWILGAYFLITIVIFILFRDWFLAFLFSIFTERLLWMLKLFFGAKLIHNERNFIINIIYILLSIPLSILLSLIIIIVLSYIF